jgi:hypothetical protein
VRTIKPDPLDPDWKFPYAKRARIEKLIAYFAKFATKQRYFGGTDKQVLPENRKNKIPWESVPPQYRYRCQLLFNRKIAQEKAKGIPGWPTWGKVNSIRMNVTNAGRHSFNGDARRRYAHYKSKKNMWLAWLKWNNEQQHAQRMKELGPTASRRLEI